MTGWKLFLSFHLHTNTIAQQLSMNVVRWIFQVSVIRRSNSESLVPFVSILFGLNPIKSSINLRYSAEASWIFEINLNFILFLFSFSVFVYETQKWAWKAFSVSVAERGKLAFFEWSAFFFITSAASKCDILSIKSLEIDF